MRHLFHHGPLHRHIGSVMYSERCMEGRCLMGCIAQVVARCAISTTLGGCFGGTVGIIVQLIYSKLSGGQAVWCARAPSGPSPCHACCQAARPGCPAQSGSPEAACEEPRCPEQLLHAWQWACVLLVVESACACRLVPWMLASQFSPVLRRDLNAAGNCALTGMIVITSGCATLEPWASALGGVVGGLLILPSSLFVSHVLKIDDPVDAFAVWTFPLLTCQCATCCPASGSMIRCCYHEAR